MSPKQAPSLSSSRPSVPEMGIKNNPDVEAERSSCTRSLGNYFPFGLVATSIAPPPLRPCFQPSKVNDKGSSNGRGGGASLTWKDLRVMVGNKKEGRRTILEGLTGYAEPGEVLAIMGPSGCGKSTLLDALAGRLGTNMKKTGEILVNGRKQSLAYGTSAYVRQDDMLMTTLTVREAVYYSAQLQLPNSMSKSKKLERADMVIREMGLQDSINTIIGEGAKRFFAQNGFPCPNLRNPSDHYLRTINSDFELDLEQQHEGGINIEEVTTILMESYRLSETHRQVQSRVLEICQQEGEILMEKGGQASFITQSNVLTRVGYSYSSIQARGSMIAFVVGFLTFMAIGGFPSFVEDMKIFQRERLNGHYGVEAYVIGNTFSSIPYLMLISLIPGAIAYYLVGLQIAFDHFVYFALLLFACMLLVESLMMTVASIVPDFLMGIITGAGIQGMMLLNGGFFRLPDDIPKLFWRFPMYYISFHKYAFQGLFKNEYEGLTFPNNQAGGPATIFGTEILRSVWTVEMGYSKWVDLAILFGMVVIYRFMFFVIIKIFEK
ncbi:hypothetical protein Nepgr_019321 [Nepenthes gracilis]|uniref:ABC transporter domain-containing protein n=1 Tax=Nepenthes gracilis TaxID=150966 RepID=A0AAD3STB9_NEPGR|nr:hypothetical protein Nepgr_019321 [Nepenthes gracilis]